MPLLEKAQQVLQSDTLTGLFDEGYFNGEHLKRAQEQGIKVFVAIPEKKGPAIVKEGRFSRDQFVYHAQTACYHCPQGELLTRCGTLRTHGHRPVLEYRSQRAVCQNCPLASQCLSEKARFKKLDRWEHEAVIDRHRERMQQAKGIMKKRSSLVEHPFGTLKHRAGMHHFLMRGLEKCQAEFSLMTLCYNFTRVINILGFEPFRDYCVNTKKWHNTLRTWRFLSFLRVKISKNYDALRILVAF